LHYRANFSNSRKPSSLSSNLNMEKFFCFSTSSIVRFEDLSLNPLGVLQSTMNSLNLPLTDNAFEYIRKHTLADQFNAVSNLYYENTRKVCFLKFGLLDYFAQKLFVSAGHFKKLLESGPDVYQICFK
jgi:hypothetical protein